MIKFEQGESSPYIFIRPVENLMEIKGNAFVSNPKAFYEPIINWAKDFSLKSDTKFVIKITLGYYSTSNIQIFNMMFKKLNNNNIGKIEIIFLLEKEEEEDLDETMLSLIFNSNIPTKVEYI